ncbi:MAG TPA: adenylate/guanylate cyclase domain-containing protein [Oligoflexus sp.]|uniref:adenylate/guanylate cyclase domain-containing protein n=1 Tax=Oligoflexus sp. TaxID=1971216 RepID=UPI002D3EC922|nr:adenylate/guanylate cyclase domain-containing protein [Oligoflexus sp.]HYX36595.1 adenylate/guanylate cyclase domain-containing protein [Oligoflexus sp.]
MSRLRREKLGLVPIVLALILSLGFLALYFTPVQSYLAYQIGRPLEFRFRSWLGKSPALDPRLKIFAFDEQTVGYLGYPDLTLDSWLKLAEHFGASKPRALYIDKLFSLPLQERVYDRLDPQHARAFIDGIKGVGVPVVSGGFISALQLPGRKMMSLFHPDYHVKEAPAWPPVEQGYFYGPHPFLRDAFRIGHITNSEFGYARPFIRIDPQSLVPHAAFLTLGALRVRGQQLFLGEQPIPLNRRNLIPINFSDREEYVSRGKTKSLRVVLERIRQNIPEPGITSEDIVVILPAMFTGNADWKDTPIGRLQGGYFGVALLNSVLQNAWLEESFGLSLTVLVFSVAGAMLAALLLQPWLAALSLMSLTLLLPIGGLVLFTYEGWILPWLWATLAVALGGSIVLLERMRAENQKSRLLISSLRGALSPELADSIARNPKILHGDPVEQIVSIMFVDIVGFSLTTERLTAKESFQQLKAQIEYIVEKIHQFGGLVDKSLGDGVLAFFGYHFDKGASQVGHADQALLCAIEIQKEALRRSQALNGSGKPIFPLRIGINTATVYIGNLGTEGRIDFTLIGNGVNFTARLEHACAPYRIMLGLSTFDLLAQFSPRDPGVNSKEIRIKHHKKPIRCYEFNPFHAAEGELRSVLDYYGEYHKLYTNEPRWHLEPADYIPLQTPRGEAWLVNFSVGGVAIILNQRVPTDETLRLSLVLDEGQLPLEIKVRTCWSREMEPGRVVHGCQFLDNPAEKQDRFVQGLREAIGRLGRKVQLLPRSRPAA